MHALSRVATGAIPIETLRADITQICGAFDIEPGRRNGASHGLASKRLMGGFQTAFVSLDAKIAERTLTCIRRDPGEYFFMLVQDHGQCVVHQNGQATLLRSGDMFIVDATKPSKFVYDGQLAHQISVHLPRDEMLGRFGGICSGGVPIDRSDPLWMAMRAVLAKMMQCGAEAGPPLGEALYGLMGAYFQERRLQTLDPQAQMVNRAMGIIAQNYRDPEFGPGVLAARLGVSLRTLQRNFAPLGQTPGQRLLQTRLEQAHAELSAAPPEASIADRAYGCGFNDLSHFYRVFRQRFGVTPGEVVARPRGVIVQ